MSLSALYEWLNEQTAALDAGTLEPVAIHDELVRMITANPGCTDDPAVARFVDRITAMPIAIELDIRRGPSMGQREAATTPLVFSADGRYLAAAGRHEVVLVEVATGATTRRTFADLPAPPLPRGQPGGFTPLDLVFSDDDRSLYVTLCNDLGERDRDQPTAWMQLALPALSQLAVEILDTTDRAELLAIRGDGTKLVTRTWDHLLSVERGDHVQSLGPAKCHGSGALSRDGRFAATFYSHEVEVWDLASGARIEYFRLPVGGRNRNVFEHERVDLAILVNRLGSRLCDEADIAIAPDRIHAVTATADGVEVWRIGRDPERSTNVRHVSSTKSRRVAISPDGTTIATIANGEERYYEATDSATIRIAGLLAPRPAAPWGGIPYRPLDPETNAGRRRRANELLAALAVEHRFVESAHELVALRDSTPAIREDFTLSRKIHRATVPYGVPTRVSGRRVFVYPRGVRDMTFSPASDRAVVVEGPGRAAILDLDTLEVLHELELGASVVSDFGNVGRTLLVFHKDPAAGNGIFDRYRFVAFCIDVATGTRAALGPCTAFAIHPTRDEVLLDRGNGVVERMRTDGTTLGRIRVVGGQPRFTANGTLLRLISHTHDRVDIYHYDKLETGPVSSGRLEILMGGRADPRPSLDGRFVDVHDRFPDEERNLARETLYANMQRFPRSIGIVPRASFEAVPSPIELGDAAVSELSRDGHVLALLRATTLELWLIDYECNYFEEVADELATWPTLDAATASGAVDPRRELLDQCLDRWAELRRLASRSVSTEVTRGHISVARDTLLAHLDRVIERPTHEIVQRIRLVDPELAIAYAEHANLWPLRTPTPSSNDGARLRVVGLDPHEHGLDDTIETKIGRHGDCDFQILDRTISKEHCSVWRENGVWMLRDNGTVGGTFLDGEKLVGAIPIRHGARIVIGSTTLEFDAG